MRRSTIILLAAGLLVSGLCGGCQQKFTRQRYETIYVSMPDWQVREVLGAPAEGNGDQWTYVNDMPYYRAAVAFKDGRVVGKSWSTEKPVAR